MSDNHTPEGEDAVDRAIAAFQRTPVPERPDDDAMLAFLAARQPGVNRPIAQTELSKRSFFMRPAFHFATAAAILIGVGAWLLWSPAAPFALAEVIQAAERHKVVRYRMELTVQDPNGSHSEMITSYLDLQAHRSREEHHRLTVKGEVEQLQLLHIVDPTSNRYLMIYPQDKTAYIGTYRTHPSGQTKERVKPFLDSLREMQDDKTTAFLGKDKLNGFETLKYRSEKNGRSGTLWVDGNTKLPARLESTVLHPNGSTVYRFVYTDFEWDPKVPDRGELFSLKPPEGYMVADKGETHSGGTPVAAAGSSGTAGAVAVPPPPTSKESLMEGRGRELLKRRTLEQSVTDALVIVVATALDSAPAPLKRPGDLPEVLIRFRVTRVLKGNLAEKEITTRTPTAADEFIGKEWVIMLSPEYLAGKHSFAGCCTIKLEPAVKAILSKAKK